MNPSLILARFFGRQSPMRLTGSYWYTTTHQALQVLLKRIYSSLSAWYPLLEFFKSIFWITLSSARLWAVERGSSVSRKQDFCNRDASIRRPRPDNVIRNKFFLFCCSPITAAHSLKGGNNLFQRNFVRVSEEEGEFGFWKCEGRKSGSLALDPSEHPGQRSDLICFLPEALASSKSLADVHSCFRLIVVSHPGPARPGTDADSSRPEYDSRRHVRCHSSRYLRPRIRQKSARCTGANEAGGLPRIRHHISRPGRLRD